MALKSVLDRPNTFCRSLSRHIDLRSEKHSQSSNINSVVSLSVVILYSRWPSLIRLQMTPSTLDILPKRYIYTIISIFQLHILKPQQARSLYSFVILILVFISYSMLTGLLLPFRDHQSTSYTYLVLYYTYSCISATNTLSSRVRWPQCIFVKYMICAVGTNAADTSWPADIRLGLFSLDGLLPSSGIHFPYISVPYTVQTQYIRIYIQNLRNLVYVQK